MSKNHFSPVSLFIRSLIFSIFSFVSITIYSAMVCCTAILPLRYRYMTIRGCLRFYMRVLKRVCHVDYKVEGLENIPTDKNGIIFSKHQSTWETFFLPTIFISEPAIILKRELLWIPLFGWGLALSKPIAINRKNKSGAMQQIIKQGTQTLAEGRWVLAFPEGTRVAPGQVGHYKLGAARLAATTGYPVLPIAHNAGRCWPRRKFIKQPGTVHVVIGPLIESKGRTPEEVLAIAKDWIEETMLRIDSGVDKPAS